MRLSRFCGMLALSLASGACLSTPTEDEIIEEAERLTERKARSVSGHWIGASPVLTLDFDLQEEAGSVVSGSGTMKEATEPTSVPMTVTGSYVRPRLTLTFHGLIFEGRTVQGTFQGTYTNFAGISAPLRLTATDYSRTIEFLLQEPEDELARSPSPVPSSRRADPARSLRPG